MFWDKWIPAGSLIKSEVCAMEVCYKESGTIYYYTHLKNKNKKLEIVATGVCADFLTLPPTISKNKIPLVLIINGKGVIIKKITLSENSVSDTEKIVRQNLPAIQLEDFYAQIFKQENNAAFLTLCRKGQLDALLSGIKTAKLELGAVFIGTPAIIGLQPLWTNFNTIPASLHKVELSNNALDVILSSEDANEETVKIEELSFSSHYTLGFAGGLSYLMRRFLAENSSAKLDAISSDHLEKNKLRFLVLLAVGIAFFAAVANVIFYTSYFDKNNKLETELSVYQGKYDEINQLLTDYQDNKDLIENAGILNSNKLSEYADRIGKTLPDEVLLSDLYFNPKNEDQESNDSLVTFRNKKLVLKGKCAKSFIVNEWINVLKMQRFIKDVSLEKFVYNNQGLLPNFEIQLVTE